GRAAPPASFAERQLEDAAQDDAMQRVILRQPLFVRRVGRVQAEYALGVARHRVGGQHRVAAGEALLDLDLPRVIETRAVIVERADVAELRKRPQQLRARDRRGVEAGRQQAEERVRHELREEVDRRLIARLARRQVLRGNAVEIDLPRLSAAARGQVVAAAAGVAYFEDPCAW